jgi:hypothetical protein
MVPEFQDGSTNELEKLARPYLQGRSPDQEPDNADAPEETGLQKGWLSILGLCRSYRVCLLFCLSFAPDELVWIAVVGVGGLAGLGVRYVL